MSEMAHLVGIKLYPENAFNLNSKLPCNSADIIPTILDRYSKYKIAWILHDKDKLEDGTTLCKPHIHLNINATNTEISLDKIRREFKISYHNVYPLDNWEESIKYLCHLSNRSIHDKNKYHYNVSDISANFDLSEIFDDLQIPEITIVKDICHYALENRLNLLELMDYVEDNGWSKIYRKWFYTIEHTINDAKRKVYKRYDAFKDM